MGKHLSAGRIGAEVGCPATVLGTEGETPARNYLII